jgi:hypothetical protein
MRSLRPQISEIRCGSEVVPSDDQNESIQHRRPARPFWRAAVADGSFIRASGNCEFPVFRAIGVLLIVKAFLFHIPPTESGKVLMLLYTIALAIGCWAAIFIAYRRSRWLVASASALLFGLSYISCYARHGLWAM